MGVGVHRFEVANAQLVVFGASARYAADLRHCIRAVDGDAKVFLVVQDSG